MRNDVYRHVRTGDNALTAAVLEAKSSAHADIVKALLDHEPSLACSTVQHEFRYSALIHLMTGAAFLDDVDGAFADADRAIRIGSMLLDAGANPMYTDKEGGYTFLHWSLGIDHPGVEAQETNSERTLHVVQTLFQHPRIARCKEQLVLAKDVMGLTIIDNLIIRRNDDLAPFLLFLLQQIAGEKAHKLLTEVHKCDITSEDASSVYYHGLSLSIVSLYHGLSLSIVSLYHRLSLSIVSLYHGLSLSIVSLYHRLSLSIVSLYHRLSLSIVSLYHRLSLSIVSLYHRLSLSIVFVYHRHSLSIDSVYHRLCLSVVSVYHRLYSPGVRHARIGLPWHARARGDGAL